jgi:signal transduction histidine kinase
MPVGVIFVDENDDVAYVNPLGEQIRCVGERRGRPVSECHPGHTHSTLGKVMRMFRAGPPEYEHPIVMERMQKYEVTYARVENEAHDYRGVLWMAQDISRRKQLEQQLMHAERLAGLGRMAARFAHDIKNPLNAIQGAAHYLQQETNGGEASELPSLIKDQVKRIADLIDRLNTLTRPLQPRFEPADLAELVESQLCACSIACGAAERWSLDIDEGLVEIPCDSALVERLVCNAVENAFAAMGDQGHLECSISLRTESDGSWAVIQFDDSGPGLPQEILDNLFQPFTTTRTEGTGLGLTIMNEICMLHGGDLKVENTEGGALITATLSTR